MTGVVSADPMPEAGEEFDPALSNADASRPVDELQESTGPRQVSGPCDPRVRRSR